MSMILKKSSYIPMVAILAGLLMLSTVSHSSFAITPDLNSILDKAFSLFGKDFLIKSAFDITNKGVDSQGNPFMKVKGIAGSVIPLQKDKIYAYVFITDKGIYAVASHAIEDSTEVRSDLQWHAHKVTLNTANCITSITEDGDASLRGQIVKVLNTAKPINLQNVLTAELTIGNSGPCVTKVFDQL